MSEDDKGLRTFLLAHGTSPEEIAAAEAESPEGLRLLAVDRLLLPYAGRYTGPEVAERAGVPYEMTQRFWRSMGFVEPPLEEKVFTDADVETLSIARDLLEREIADPLLALQLTRVMGLSLARLAEAQVTAWRDRRVVPVREEDFSPSSLDDLALGQLEDLLKANESFLIYVWRRHLAAASKRSALLDDPGQGGGLEMGTGFADLVGFTRLSQELEERDLGALVDRFESTSHETITGLGGRLVKMIGDEVMFVADDPGTIAEVGLTLVEQHSIDDALPPLRVGVTWGSVLARDGDYYGPPVNLASRIVSVALPGTVIANDAIHDALHEDERFVVKRIRPRTLKGIGPASLSVVRRPPQDRPARL